jgi:hypothetical protein
MANSRLHHNAARQHERWTQAHDMKLKKMIRDGKNSEEIATELGRTRAAVMGRKAALGITQKMAPARGSKMPYTAYDKTRTTNNGVKNAKSGIDLKAELEKEIEAGNLPTPGALLEAASSHEPAEVEVQIFEKKVDKKKIDRAVKAAKAYSKAEKREVKAMVEVSKALNKIIKNSKKKHRTEFIKALKKTNNFPLISELVR